MAENYKHLYEQTKKMLTMYQDELTPGFRQKIDELEADNERLRKGWAEAISAHSKSDSQIPRWIPVTERLPEENDDGSVNAVLVTNGYIQHMAYFKHGIWCFTENGEMKEPMFYDITHWMPLPEPPKEE